MKYSRLSTAELENLKDDFIKFLASQGIDADAWAKLKENQITKAEGIIDVYSDLVYDQALSNCKFLEHLSAKEFKTMKFDENTVHLIGLKVAESSTINLNTNKFKEDVQRGLDSNEISVFTAVKPLENQRELEMFDWLKKGAYMANGDWYKQLALLL